MSNESIDYDNELNFLSLERRFYYFYAWCNEDNQYIKLTS